MTVTVPMLITVDVRTLPREIDYLDAAIVDRLR